MDEPSSNENRVPLITKAEENQNFNRTASSSPTMEEAEEEENSPIKQLSQTLRNLKACENDSTVNVVILKGKGKAFCAGGDVVKLVHYMTAGHWTFGASFYRKQLTLDYILATYKKPLVSLINGIVMGGGAGLSIHGTFRIVTEKTVFAMPETSIGLVPDVGSSYFLSRLPGSFGEYLGLTGARINGSEMLACGLATHFVLSKDIHLVENALCETDSSDTATISHLINKFVHKSHVNEDSAYRRLEIINKCFSKKTVEEILSSLENEVANRDDKWLVETISSLNKASPTSLKISLKSIREGRMQKLEQCLMRDYTILCHMVRRTVSNNFYEGVRAILFDKDNNPKWEPSKIEQVTEEMVDLHFTKAEDDDDWEDLQLPVRVNLTSMARPRL